MINAIKELINDGYEVIFSPWLHPGKELTITIRKNGKYLAQVIPYNDLRDSRLDPDELIKITLNKMKNKFEYDRERTMNHDQT